MQNLEKDDIYSSKIFSNSNIRQKPLKSITKQAWKKNIKLIPQDKQDKKFIYHNYESDNDSNDNEISNENEEEKIYLKEIEKISIILEHDLIKQKK